MKIKNNFLSGVEFVNPIDELLKEYNNIIEGKSESYSREYNQYGFDELEESHNEIT